MSPRSAILQVAALARIPRAPARFYVRAIWRAWREGDRVSLNLSARARELRPILAAAGDAEDVAEIGTGSAWTAIALTLAHPSRRVLSVDVEDRPQRQRYLDLMSSSARERLTLVSRPGEQGPAAGEGPFEFLFIDSSHEYDETVATFESWAERVIPGGAVAFHDHRNPNYPEVSRAIRAMGLEGQESHLLFVWRKPPISLDR